MNDMLKTWAERVNTSGAYVLHVPPVRVAVAERILQEEFGADWRAHLEVDDRLSDDAWYVVYPNAHNAEAD